MEHPLYHNIIIPLTVFISALTSTQCESSLERSRRLLSTNHSVALPSRETHDIDLEKLATRNGIADAAIKRNLFLTYSVFVDEPLRSLFYDKVSGRENPKPDAEFEFAVVCRGGEATYNFQYILCPTTGGYKTNSYKNFLNDYSDVYCCHQPPFQSCCNEDKFYSWEGHLKKPKIKGYIIALIVVGSVLLLAGVIGVSIFLCFIFSCGMAMCRRSRIGGHGRGSTTGGAVYPAGGGGYPTAVAVYPAGGGGNPTVGGGYPTAGGGYPAAGGGYSTEVGGKPTGGGGYPVLSGSGGSGY